MATKIKRVCGGYLLTEIGHEDCNKIMVVKVGEERKVISELLGFIFDNYLQDYGNSCTIDFSIDVHLCEEDDEETYINDELFSDEIGYTDEELIPKKKER
jgi:hypothetical protein